MGPSYIKLANNGELESRIKKAKLLLDNCSLCPRNCRVNRYNSEVGFCNSTANPVVSSYTLHFGEEPVISGTNGTGNIFFGNCNLRCVYCQNFEISQNWKSENINEVTATRLAEIMHELQNRGAHNIGLVSPTHFSAQILEAIYIAAKNGLKLPLIYNSNGYDSVHMLKLFENVIDIYLPDFKYGNDVYAFENSRADNYFETAKEALKEMFSQVGDRIIFENGLAVHGMIIRHLVLPNEIADTEKVFEFIANVLSPKIYVSLMSQYFPTHNARNFVLLNRKIRNKEYENAISLLEKYGLTNGWIQELESSDLFVPNFNSNRESPFHT